MNGSAAGIGHGVVVGIEGLGDQDLVAVVQNAVHGDLQSLAAAVGDENIALFKVHAQIVIVLLDGVDQHGNTGRRCVLQNGQVKVTHGLEVSLGGLDIRLADIQMVDLLAFCFCRHGIRMKLTHGGQAAFQNLAGKLHDIASSYDLTAEPVVFCAHYHHTSLFFPKRQEKMKEDGHDKMAVLLLVILSALFRV